MFDVIDEEKVFPIFDFQCVECHPECYGETQCYDYYFGELLHHVHERAAEKRAKPVHKTLTECQNADKQHVTTPAILFLHVKRRGSSLNAERKRDDEDKIHFIVFIKKRVESDIVKTPYSVVSQLFNWFELYCEVAH